MIFALTLALTTPFTADVERVDCRQMQDYSWIREPDAAPGERIDPHPDLGAPHFFPNGAFTRFDGSSSGFLCAWYTIQLNALEQAPLVGPSNRDVLRFTWLRSFHDPISITVALDGHIEGELVWTRTDGAGGYEPGQVVEQGGRVVSPRALAHIQRLLDQAHPCDLVEEDILQADGARWIFETLDQERYCIFSGLSPSRDEDAYHQLGRALLDLTTLSIDPDDIY